MGRLIGCEGYAHVGELVDDASLPVDPHVRPRIQLGRRQRPRLPGLLGSGRPVGDCPHPAKGVKGLLDRKQRRRFEL